MAEYLINDSTLQDIANSIRAKTGKTGTITPKNMPSEITSIETGTTGITPSGTKNITSNGTYDVTTYASAKVNVDTLKVDEVNVVSSSVFVPSEFPTYLSYTLTDGTNTSTSKFIVANTDPIVPEVIKSGTTILGVTGNMPAAQLGFKLCLVDFSYIKSQTGKACTHEISGFVVPCSYNDWYSHKTNNTINEYAISHLMTSFDTLSDLATIGWQATYSSFITAQSKPFIIWSESNIPPSATSGGLDVLGHMGCGVFDGWEDTQSLPTLTSDTCHRFDSNTQKIYYGYICRVTTDTVVLNS